MSRLTTTLRALGALATLLVLVVGVPLAMAATIGNPAHGWADLTAGDLTDQVLIDLLAVIVWLAWAQFTVSVVAEVAAAAHHVPVLPHIRFVPGASQQLAHTLVGAALLLGTVTAALAGPAHALAGTLVARPVAATSPMASVHAHHPGAPASAVDLRRDARPARQRTASQDKPHTPNTYVVPGDGRGPDTLWDIAAARLGGGEHWRKIWDLNRGRTQPDGTVMTDPGLLEPGWTILLPPAAAGPHHGAVAVEDVSVHSGDTLSGIAAAHGIADWHQLWGLDRGMGEPDGQHFTDPNLIRPGWRIPVPLRNPSTTAPAGQADTSRAPRTAAATGDTANSTVPAAPSEPAPAVAQPAVPSTSADQHTTYPAATRPTHDTTGLPMVAFAAGGGVLLAGVSLAALARYRRRQFRWRQPGRTIAATPPALQPIERALRATGADAAADVTWLDHALRGLAQTAAATETGTLPDLVAVRMSADTIELILTGPHPGVPQPWNVDESGTRWSITRDDDAGYNPARRGYQFAPYPMLASVGHTATGEHWLLDLERIGGLSLYGDRQRCLDLARFVAAELGHNTWSEMLQVTLVGFGEELVDINSDRLTHSDDAEKAIAASTHNLGSVRDALDSTGVDLLAGRLRDIVGDAWAPHVLLLAPDAAADADGIDQLLAALRAQSGRAATALALITDDPALTEATRWQLGVDEHGTLRVPALGIELIAEQVPAEEAAQLAQMLALAATLDDRPVPDAEGDKPWAGYADAAGNLRRSIAASSVPLAAGDRGETDAVAMPRLRGAPDETDSASRAPDSVLPLPAQIYLDQAATTMTDLDELAPPVDHAARADVHSADPELDRDLAAWHDLDCPRPKVRLLGPITVTAQGLLPEHKPRLLWNTEIVAYLATRSGPVSLERYGTDMWPDEPGIASKTKARQSISVVRHWLGLNPRTGQEYLPKGVVAGLPSPYRLEDVLVDAELFRRLRLRGTASGTDGIADLRAALDLVAGAPFSERRPGGYGWLTENPLDHIYAAMIVDVAHTLATHHLASGEPEAAASAARVALKAGSSEDTPLLDLAAACDAQGNRAEADAYIHRILTNHDAEVEEDLPPRTAEILHRRQWLDHAG